MKICFLAPANNYHTQKWVRYFADHGHEVYVLSLTDGQINGAHIYWLNSKTSSRASDVSKLKYLFQFINIKRIVKKIQPDIINAHYASSYGTLAALAGLKNHIVSVWGSDVYDFPRKSFLHRKMLTYSLNSASCIFSTSRAMAKETSQYTDKEIFITPFGVDVELFNPNKRTRGEDGKFIIGTVKKLEPKYGIAGFLKAIKIIKSRRPDIPLEVRIAGNGSHEMEYHQLSQNLGISDNVKWLGFISQKEAAKEWANMDCAIIFSESESFGVSAVEANAAGIPCIISDIPGLMEATKPGETSIVVPRGQVELLAGQIIDMYDCPMKRKRMGENGRRFACETYELNHCFRHIEALYRNLLRR